jgi:hypothetical protein
MRRVLLACLLACGGLVATAGVAHARREHAFSYPFVRVWETAVRLLRVDFASPIGEKNREDGYFLFEYPYNGKSHPGSLEVVRAGEGRVRVVVQIPAMPSYVEQMVLDKLERKLASEYGAPPEPTRKEPTAPAPVAPAKTGADPKPPAPRDEKAQAPKSRS